MTINVFVKCDKDGHHYPCCTDNWEKKGESGCVDFNVYVECDKEKK